MERAVKDGAERTRREKERRELREQIKSEAEKAKRKAKRERQREQGNGSSVDQDSEPGSEGEVYERNDIQTVVHSGSRRSYYEADDPASGSAGDEDMQTHTRGRQRPKGISEESKRGREAMTATRTLDDQARTLTIYHLLPMGPLKEDAPSRETTTSVGCYVMLPPLQQQGAAKHVARRRGRLALDMSPAQALERKHKRRQNARRSNDYRRRKREEARKLHL
ncbi:hypothetical protein MMC30_001304 [Trapelia coarctata]|nr:hypothetical protein [Trapelia coarctata]